MRRSLHCEIQPDKDGRRQKKDRLAHLQHKATALDAVLDVIKRSDADQARVLIDFMRNNDSHSDILAFAQGMMHDINQSEIDPQDPERNHAPNNEADQLTETNSSASLASQPDRHLSVLQNINPLLLAEPPPSLSASTEASVPVPTRARTGLSVMALLNDD
jgi:hypothetical protein